MRAGGASSAPQRCGPPASLSFDVADEEAAESTLISVDLGSVLGGRSFFVRHALSADSQCASLWASTSFVLPGRHAVLDAAIRVGVALQPQGVTVNRGNSMMQMRSRVGRKPALAHHHVS